MWLDEYRIDGLRVDGTVFIRTADFSGDRPIPEGYSLLQEINAEVRRRFPGRLLIAEDLRENPEMTRPVEAGGAGFDTQWDGKFAYEIRRSVITPVDEERSMQCVAEAIADEVQRRRLPADHLQRVARRGGQRQGAGALRDQQGRRDRLALAEAVDAGRGAGVHGAGHPDALPGSGVPGGGVVPRRHPARLGPEPGVPRDRPAVPRPDRAAARPRGHRPRAPGAGRAGPPGRRGAESCWRSGDGTAAGRATTW